MKKFNLLAANGMSSSSPSELVLATRDCVIISNDAGGGEQDTTMTDEKWQQSVPLPRKKTANGSTSSSTVSSSEVSSHENNNNNNSSEAVTSEMHRQHSGTDLVRAQSPVISAFIGQRLESLSKEHSVLDTMTEYKEEGEGSSKVSLESYCSYQPQDEAYTMERLRRAGPEFQKFAGLLEVLCVEERDGEDGEDVESKIAHTGLTQTQTQSQGEVYF